VRWGRQVETLEHHAQARAQTLDLTRVGDLCDATAPRLQTHFFAVDSQAAAAGDFQQVDATQQGTFARTTGADQRDHLALFGAHRNALEHVVIGIALVQVIDGDDRGVSVWLGDIHVGECLHVWILEF